MVELPYGFLALMCFLLFLGINYKIHKDLYKITQIDVVTLKILFFSFNYLLLFFVLKLAYG